MKKPYDLPLMFRRIAKAIQPLPKAAMFELYERGYTSLFEQLISCIISIRTLDETTIPVSLRLFREARDPGQLLRMGEERIVELLYGATFPEPKAATMLAVARLAMDQGGSLPPDYEQLTSVRGVGPKCANLALGVTGHLDAISVDVHVHRVTNRWGLVQASTPEKTMKELETLLPRKRWTDVNRLLMPFGKHICTRVRPHCSTCPVLEYCRQVGVTTHR